MLNLPYNTRGIGIAITVMVIIFSYMTNQLGAAILDLANNTGIMGIATYAHSYSHVTNHDRCTMLDFLK